MFTYATDKKIFFSLVPIEKNEVLQVMLMYEKGTVKIGTEIITSNGKTIKFFQDYFTLRLENLDLKYSYLNGDILV